MPHGTLVTSSGHGLGRKIVSEKFLLHFHCFSIMIEQLETSWLTSVV